GPRLRNVLSDREARVDVVRTLGRVRVEGGVENQLSSSDQQEVVQRQAVGADVFKQIGEHARIESLALRRHDRPRRRRALLARNERQTKTKCQSKDNGE